MLLKLLLIQRDNFAFEFTTDTILLAFDKGGVTVQSTKLERNFVLGGIGMLHFNYQLLLFCEGGLLCLKK